MKTVLYRTIMLAIVAGAAASISSSFAAAPQPTSQPLGHVLRDLVPTEGDQVIPQVALPSPDGCFWNNGNADGLNGLQSQTLGSFTARVADDYVLEAGQWHLIDSIKVCMAVSNNVANPVIDLEIYDDCNGRPGSLRRTLSTSDYRIISANQPFSGFTLVEATFALSEFDLGELNGCERVWLSPFGRGTGTYFWPTSNNGVVQGGQGLFKAPMLGYPDWAEGEDIVNFRRCSDFCFQVCGKVCYTIKDQGDFDLDGLSSIKFPNVEAFDSRAADNFQIAPSRGSVDLCRAEGYFATNCDVTRVFAEILANNCDEPGSLLYTLGDPEIIPQEGVTFDGLPVYLFRFDCPPNVRLSGGNNYWFSMSAVSGGTIFDRGVFLFKRPPGNPCLRPRTYTLDADFDEGNTVNIDRSVPDQLQLPLSQPQPFPFVNIACSARGTVARVDVNTGEVLGEYRTAPQGRPSNPSRTTVDQLGNVWVSNRDESSVSPPNSGTGRGSITRIGLVIGGTRGDKLPDGSFVPNPGGEYLQPPFIYNTCIDRDGDGLIRTSTGLFDILPWSNAGGADTHGGVSTAEDECIINFTRVIATNTRTIAVDANNDIWVGGNNTAHEKVSGISGQPVAGTAFNLNCGGYGGFIDGSGVLWSAQYGLGLLRYNTNTLLGSCLGTPGNGNYGLGVDPNTGEVWYTSLFGNNVAKLGPAGNVLGSFQHGNDAAQGVAVDASGNVWVAHSLFNATTVGHIRTNGQFVGNVPLVDPNNPAIIGVGPTGVAVDANGKIWVANINTNNAMRIDPNAGPIGGGGFRVGAVDLTVDLGAGSGPYNYSDMTGFVVVGSTAPEGTWTTVYDGCEADVVWDTISWNSLEPAGTGVSVEARAANAQAALPGQLFVPVTNAGSLGGLSGRYIEIRTTLSRDPNVNNVTPVLFDLTVAADAPPTCADIHITEGVYKNPFAGFDVFTPVSDPGLAGSPREFAFRIYGAPVKEAASSQTPPAEGDANSDGFVNFQDVQAILRNWGSTR